MKRLVINFVFGAALLLSVVPVINLLTGGLKDGDVSENRKKGILGRLYNVDSAEGLLQKSLVHFSISLNPSKALIGSGEWYFLGDGYNSTLSSHRSGATVYDELRARQVLDAYRSWDAWFRAHGVRCFRVMICPDKPTIYPEFLPRWALKTNDHSMPMDLLLREGSPVATSPREGLLKTKKTAKEDLYYRTDTHWNSRGAWVGYKSFFDGIQGSGFSDLRTLSGDQVSFVGVGERVGDTIRTLRITDSSKEKNVGPRIKTDQPILVEQIDYDTGKVTGSGGNPEIGFSQRPLLVLSRNALNEKRVLWLRDSFGTALSPFMNATFGQVLQSHYIFIDQKELVRLVEKFHPEYVFITVVERDILLDWFTKSAPPNDKTP